jgi:hypothetical protein
VLAPVARLVVGAVMFVPTKLIAVTTFSSLAPLISRLPTQQPSP